MNLWHFSAPRGLRLLLCALWTASVVALGATQWSYSLPLESHFVEYALVGVCTLYLFVFPRWLDFFGMLALAVSLLAFDHLGRGFPLHFDGCVSMVGVGALLLLGKRAFWDEVPAARCGLTFTICYLGTSLLSPWLLEGLIRLNPTLLDLYLYSFESSLHVQVSYLAAQFMHSSRWIFLPAYLCYLAIGFPLALCFGGQLARLREKAAPLMLPYLLAAPVGLFLFNWIPAIGPRRLFPQLFPYHPFPTAYSRHLVVGPILATGAPPNSIPSLHLTWALLAWWTSRGLHWSIRAVLLFFLLMTALATMGTGEHYLVDLVVALPFSVFLEALCAYDRLPMPNTRRASLILYGGGGLLLWFSLLRYLPSVFWISPFIPWALVALTIGTSFWLERLLPPPGARAQTAVAISEILAVEQPD